jgi:hypothetical protein
LISPGKSCPSPAAIGPSSVTQSEDWYSLVVGVEIQFRNDVAAWTSNDQANHRIAFLGVPGLSDDADKARHNGMHHCAFEFDSFDDLMNHFDRYAQQPSSRHSASITA